MTAPSHCLVGAGVAFVVAVAVAAAAVVFVLFANGIAAFSSHYQCCCLCHLCRSHSSAVFQFRDYHRGGRGGCPPDSTGCLASDSGRTPIQEEGG